MIEALKQKLGIGRKQTEPEKPDEIWDKRLEDTNSALAHMRKCEMVSFDGDTVQYNCTEVHEHNGEQVTVSYEYEVSKNLSLTRREFSTKFMRETKYGDIHPLALPGVDAAEYMDSGRIILRNVFGATAGKTVKGIPMDLEITPEQIIQL